MTLNLGVDPGSVYCAWAVVEVPRDRGAKPCSLAHGIVGPAELRPALRDVLDAWQPGRAAVEVPRLCGSATQQLIETAVIAGRCLQYLEDELGGALRCTSWEWRNHVVGVSGAKNSEIKAALTALLASMPRVKPAKDASHVHDAIGVALWAGAQPADEALVLEEVGR